MYSFHLRLEVIFFIQTFFDWQMRYYEEYKGKTESRIHTLLESAFIYTYCSGG